MWGEVISAGVGMVIGVITGLFFERREIKSANRQNAQLEARIEALRTDVYSLGGDPDRGAATRPPDDLDQVVLERIRATQDASGRVARRKVVAHFIKSGVSAADIEAALAELARAGAVREDGRWLRVR